MMRFFDMSCPRAWLIAWLAWALCLGVCGFAGADDSISLDQYRAKLDEGISLIEDGPKLAPVLHFAQDIEYLTVVLPDDNVMQIDNGWLVRECQRIERLESKNHQAAIKDLLPGLKSLVAQLDRLTERAAIPSLEQSTDEALESILNQPRFQVPQESQKLVNFVERVQAGMRESWEWTKDFLRKLFQLDKPDPDQYADANWSDRLTQIVLLSLVGVLVGLLTYYILQGLRGVAVREHELEELLENEKLDEKELRLQAEQLAVEGNFRLALRRLFLSVLARLQAMGLIEYNRARTNREYLKNLTGHPSLHSSFSPVINRFDQVWYGLNEIDETEFATFSELADVLLTKARAGRGR